MVLPSARLWPHYYYYFFLHFLLTLFNLSGLVDGGLSVLDVNLPSRTHPHWLDPTIYQSETSPERSSTPSECIGLEARSMVSVAVKVSSPNPEHNIKVATPITYWLNVFVNFGNNLFRSPVHQHNTETGLEITSFSFTKVVYINYWCSTWQPHLI